MSIQSPLARLPVKRSKVTEARDPVIPEEIRLPDGRVFRTDELLAAKSKRQSINLLNHQKKNQRLKNQPRPGSAKYTYGDRVWIVNATAEAILKRYPNMRADYVTSLKQQSRDIVFRIESQADMVIIERPEES